MLTERFENVTEWHSVTFLLPLSHISVDLMAEFHYVISRSILCPFRNACDLSTEQIEISNQKLISQAALTDVLTTFYFTNALPFDRIFTAFMLDLSNCVKTFVAY